MATPQAPSLRSLPVECICTVCEATDCRLDTCQQCCGIYYCSKLCQRADWRSHNFLCKAFDNGGDPKLLDMITADFECSFRWRSKCGPPGFPYSLVNASLEDFGFYRLSPSVNVAYNKHVGDENPGPKMKEVKKTCLEIRETEDVHDQFTVDVRDVGVVDFGYSRKKFFWTTCHTGRSSSTVHQTRVSSTDLFWTWMRGSSSRFLNPRVEEPYFDGVGGHS